MSERLKQNLPIIIAVLISTAALIYYLQSGGLSFDQKIQELKQSPTVENVSMESRNRITIKCKNGTSYELLFKKDNPNFEQLIFNACGAEGTQESV
jgi:hypothetical protein